MAFDTYARIVKDDDLAGNGSGTSGALFTLGARHAKSGNEYVYIYNGGNSNIATGQYCVLQASGGSLTSGYTCTVTNASQAGWMAGVAQNTITTGYYGWVMARGVAVVVPDSGAVSLAAGVDLALGTDGGFVAAGATFSTAPRVGFTINTMVTAAGAGKARIFGVI